MLKPLPPYMHSWDGGRGQRREWIPPCIMGDLPVDCPFLLPHPGPCSWHMWVSAKTSSAGSLLYISSARRSHRIIGFEWEGDRCLILIIVLRESVFHISDILDDNSFGHAGWKITFLRLAPAAAFIRGWCLVPLHSITLQFEADSLWWRREQKKSLGLTLFSF